MKKATAPKGGYDFEAKSTYREQIWKVFKDRLQPDAKIAFLPSKEGLEIPIALSCGFKEENLYAIDKNPAILASAKWRKTYPKVNVIGLEVGRSGCKLKDNGINISAANLDLCGNLSRDMINNIGNFIHSDCINGDGLIAINLLKGRESSEVNEMAEILFKYLKKSVPNMQKRNGTVMSIAVEGYGTITPIKSGEYKSGPIVMSWSVCQVFGDQFFQEVEDDRIRWARDFYSKKIAELLPGIDKLDRMISIHDNYTQGIHANRIGQSVFDCQDSGRGNKVIWRHGYDPPARVVDAAVVANRVFKWQCKIRELKAAIHDSLTDCVFRYVEVDCGGMVRSTADFHHAMSELSVSHQHQDKVYRIEGWYPEKSWRQGREKATWGRKPQPEENLE